MSVKISVGANIEPALSALKRIDAASREAARGNKLLADSVAKVNEQLEEAKNISPGFRDALKNTGQMNKPINEIDWGKFSTNPKLAANMRTRAVNYATAGTGFEPTGSSGGGAGGSRSGGFSTLPIPGMMKGVLALAGIGGLTSMASKSADLARADNLNVDNLVRASDSLTTEFDIVSKEISSIGVGFGIATVEAGKLAKIFSELSGETKTAIVAENTRNAIALSKGFGMNTGSTVRSMGHMNFMMGGKMQQKELGTIIADGIISGGMFAKGDEVMGAIERYIESSERVLVQPPDVAAYAALKAAMDSSSSPGLRGRGGEAALSTIDNGIRNPGAGEAGEYFMYRAIGQGLSVPKFKYLQEAGMLGSMKNQGLGKDTEFNLTKTMRRFKVEQKDPYMRAMSESNVLGITMHQAMAFEEINDTFKPNETHKFLQAAKDAKIDLKKVSPGVYKDLGVIANSKAPKDDIIEKMKTMAADNIASTASTETENTIAAFESAMTAQGKVLLVPLNAIKDSTTRLMQDFKKVYSGELSEVDFSKYFGMDQTHQNILDDRVKTAINKIVESSNNADDFKPDLGFFGGESQIRVRDVQQTLQGRKDRMVEFGEATVVIKDERGKVLNNVHLRPYTKEGVTAPQ